MNYILRILTPAAPAMCLFQPRDADKRRGSVDSPNLGSFKLMTDIAEHGAIARLLVRPTRHLNLLVVAALVVAPSFTAFAQGNRARAAWTVVGQTMIAIENVSVVDGNNPVVQRNKTVLIVGNKIDAIGDAGKVRIPAKARRINGTGKYLIPGLWDSHVHLDTADPLPVFVANGVTTVREMGGDIQQVKGFRDRVTSGALVGPRIKIAGTIIESQKWLTWATDLAKKDNDTRLLATLSLRIGVTTPESAVEAVRKLAEQGVDLVKVRNTHSADTFLALLAEAKKHGIPVAAHAPRMSLIDASNGGLKSIEHVEGVTSARGDASVEDLSRAFVTNGTLYTPTLVCQVFSRLTPKAQIAELLSDVDGKKNPQNLYVPRIDFLKWKQMFDMQKNEGTFDRAAEVRKGIDEFRRMHKMGVRTLAGTDFGTPFSYPGFSLHDELEALVNQGGLTPFESLQTATKNPPYFFGMQDQIGTIEVGKLADLVMLDGNPLENISNTRKIDSVVLNGKLLSRTNLETVLKIARTSFRND
jgi:imidazolonepropionase-like amidohydrolase